VRFKHERHRSEAKRRKRKDRSITEDSSPELAANRMNVKERQPQNERTETNKDKEETKSSQRTNTKAAKSLTITKR